MNINNIKQLQKQPIKDISNKDIIKKEINSGKVDISSLNKNINQHKYYENHKEYYIKKATEHYKKNSVHINKLRRDLYKKRLEKHNIKIKPLFNNEYKLQQCKEYALSKNGECLSDEYKNRLSYLKWRCEKGHEWNATSHNILNRNQWCPRCSAIKANKDRKLKFIDIKKLAKNNNGRLLSKKEDYINTDSKLLWQCQIGHKWKASIGSIKYGKTWCPQCKNNYKEELTRYIFETYTGLSFVKIRPNWLKNPDTNKNLELDGYNGEYNIGFEYNGRQHYEHNNFFHKNDSFNAQEKRDDLKKLLCNKKGIKLCIINNIQDDKELKEYIYNWLLKNNIKIVSTVNLKNMKSFKFSKHDMFKKFVDSLGYELLDTYKGINTKINIKCNNGHIWKVQPRAVKNGNRCPFCSHKIKYTLTDIKDKAKKLNLICLEDEYKNNTVFMKFKCKQCSKIIKRTSTQIFNKKGCKCGN